VTKYVIPLKIKSASVVQLGLKLNYRFISIL